MAVSPRWRKPVPARNPRAHRVCEKTGFVRTHGHIEDDELWVVMEIARP